MGVTVVATAQTRASVLRDITVTTSGNSAVITLLVTGRVTTIVVEPKPNGMAEVRMKPMTATQTALGSARLKPGVRKVAAHIERVDVLVTDVTFTRSVENMRVSHRDSQQVTVVVKLGASLSAADTVTAAHTGESDKGSGSAEGLRPERQSRWALSTIVIDPGHGGRDPGTTGIDSVQEKDVTLAVAMRLRDELEREMPGVNVVMTRDKDEFIELEKRGEIANRSGGRLFISIHCNAMPDKPNPRNGFECYILRPGRSDDAARVAAAENDVIRYEAKRGNYDRRAAEIAIISSMAQYAFARYSENAAQSIRKSLKNSISIPDRGIHQAGFYVLVGTAMPAVLLEIGYLTNAKDVKALTNSWIQRKIARAIARGVKTYDAMYRASMR